MTPEYLDRLVTESSDPDLAEIDTLDTLARLELMNREDARVAAAVRLELPQIALAVRQCAHSLRHGGRVIYVGAGTSGRVATLDASECPPTFGTEPGLVQALMAGGMPALVRSSEGVEDDADAGAHDLAAFEPGPNDTVIGISASGRTPYVIGALHEAKRRSAATIAVVNNKPSELEKIAAVTIAPVAGPEFLAGSTRLKAGTAQKMVLNMISTNAMIEIGKTYGNLMVDVQASNEKLRARAVRLVVQVTGAPSVAAETALGQAGGNAKLAILLVKAGLDPVAARELLAQHQGHLRRALIASGTHPAGTVL